MLKRYTVPIEYVLFRMSPWVADSDKPHDVDTIDT